MMESVIDVRVASCQQRRILISQIKSVGSEPKSASRFVIVAQDRMGGTGNEAKTEAGRATADHVSSSVADGATEQSKIELRS